jgi:hypothetical protein
MPDSYGRHQVLVILSGLLLAPMSHRDEEQGDQGQVRRAAAAGSRTGPRMVECYPQIRLNGSDGI